MEKTFVQFQKSERTYSFYDAMLPNSYILCTMRTSKDTQMNLLIENQHIVKVISRPPQKD